MQMWEGDIYLARGTSASTIINIIVIIEKGTCNHTHIPVWMFSGLTTFNLKYDPQIGVYEHFEHQARGSRYGGTVL